MKKHTRDILHVLSGAGALICAGGAVATESGVWWIGAGFFVIGLVHFAPIDPNGED